jgi:hypothetical protein
MEVERGDIAVSRIQEGFREQSFTQKSAVELAQHITTTEQRADIPIPLADGRQVRPSQAAEEFNAEQVAPTADSLRRTRKVVEVLEDSLGTDLGHTKFARAASSAAKLSSIGSILIAANQLLGASRALWNESQKVGNLDAVADKTYDDFYRSCSILVIECFLFQTPLNYHIAWRGTRYLNNRYLYRLRDFSQPLYRYVLSEVHYLIRGIGPAALRSVSDYITYLVSAVSDTAEIIWQSVDKEELDDLEQRVRELANEFQEFAQTAYNIDAPDLSRIDSFKMYGGISAELDERIGVVVNPA